jgi:hypothetical protein
MMLLKTQVFLSIGGHIKNFTIEVKREHSCEIVHKYSRQSTVCIT